MKELKRNAFDDLTCWYRTPKRAPLVVLGPRQCGKSYLIKQFAMSQYAPSNIIEINFYKDITGDSKEKFSAIFKSSRDPKVILNKISLLIERDIDPTQDILLMDEIQDCKEAYESLKTFKDDYPDFPIIVTGSYLRLFLENNSSIKYPVGCSEYLLGPLTFSEFLQNFNPTLFREYVAIDILAKTKIDEIVHAKLINALHHYFFVGGMPDVVFNYVTLFRERPNEAVKICGQNLKDLNTLYMRDLAKYGSTYVNIEKIKKIFLQVPHYLQRQHEEVGAMVFKQIDPSRNYKYIHLQSAFDYLFHSGLIIKSKYTDSPKHPLNLEKVGHNQFKCFYFDLGLLNNALGISYLDFFDEKQVGFYKGYIAENFAAIQIQSAIKSNLLCSYKKGANEGAAEIEFLIAKGGDIIPIEVKSSRKSTRAKSMNSYVSDFHPRFAYKCIPGNRGTGNGYEVIPLYLIEKIFG